MKLPPAPQLDIAQQIEEFDIWITASLGEIRDSKRFQAELERIAALFDALDELGGCFNDKMMCDAKTIAKAIFGLTRERTPADAFVTLHSAAALLFLVTGKSDNNAKCQFPLHLRDVAKRGLLPAIRKRKGKLTLASRKLPRVLRADDYMGLVANLADYPDEQLKLLNDFVAFLLSDSRCAAQLWSIGHSYLMLKPMGKGKDLLTPLVIFQVRGSVSASGGHAPEALLRQRLVEWGMVPDLDFNLCDVVIDNGNDEKCEISDAQIPLPLDEAEEDDKTRAYDFVLPFKTPLWSRRIFVQCQFYAGDSGSVSHKNLDQTDTSRRKVEEQYKQPMFIEYVDGAGYFASLNGDLKKLLRKQSTADFFQLRSAPIRLRRALQQIGFLTLLEVEQAVQLCNGTKAKVMQLLGEQDYPKSEVERAISIGIEQRLLLAEGGCLKVIDQRQSVVRRYLLLDTIACGGAPLSSTDRRGFLLVPGYGAFFGMKMSEAVAKMTTVCAAAKSDWADATVLMQDIEWLAKQGFIIMN